MLPRTRGAVSLALSVPGICTAGPSEADFFDFDTSHCNSALFQNSTDAAPNWGFIFYGDRTRAPTHDYCKC